MTTGPTAVVTTLSSLLTSVVAELTGSLGGVPGRVCVVPGAIALDECDCAGVLMATVTEQYLTDTFPHTNVTRNPVELVPCRASWLIVDAVIQISRCVPIPDDAQDIVTCTELDAAADILYSDAWIILNTVPCVLQTLKDNGSIIDYSVANQAIDGPEGGCAGSTLAFSVAFDRGVT